MPRPFLLRNERSAFQRVSDTAHNRAVLAEHREALRASFPLDTRAVMRALEAGRTPEASGIVVL